MPGTLIESTERLALRTVEREDIEFLQRSFTNPDIRYPLGNMRHRNREGVEERFEEAIGGSYLVCIEDDPVPGYPEDTRPIGTVGISNDPWARPDMGYWLIPEVHGEGYGTEAVGAALDTFFRTTAEPSVGAGAFAFNDASRGLLESLGFQEEGRRRKSHFVDGEYRDMVVYGILREEWRAED
jgi:RimJ/RimL family protein N-acetyltransferase